MNCKFCNAELPEDVTLCPACGAENAEAAETEILEAAEEMIPEVVEEATEEIAEAAPKQKPKAWVMILAIIGAIALLAVLIGAVAYGVGAADKAESYSAADEKLVKARDTVVATLGEVELTNSELQLFYRQSINDFYSSYGYYLDASVLDLNKPLDQQIYDAETNQTWQQFFLEGALTTWSRYAALCMEAEENGFVLPEDVQQYLAEVPAQLEESALYYGYSSVKEMLEADMSLACDEEGYMAYIYTNLYAGQYLDSMYDSMIPTMEQIEEYYAANEETLVAQGMGKDSGVTTDVRHILICPKGGTEDETGEIIYSDAEWEACRVEAQKLLDQWKADGATEELFADFAMEYTEDPGSQSTGGLYTDIYVGQMVPEFEAWCFDAGRQYGDTGLVKTTYGYHIMYFVDSHEIWEASVRENMIYEASLEIVNKAAEKWPADINYKKIVIGEVAAQ